MSISEKMANMDNEQAWIDDVLDECFYSGVLCLTDKYSIMTEECEKAVTRKQNWVLEVIFVSFLFHVMFLYCDHSLYRV